MDAYLVVGRGMVDNQLKGFRLAHTSGSSGWAPLDDIAAGVWSDKVFLNAEFDPKFKTLVGTHGTSLASYPTLNEDCNVLGKNGIAIMFVVFDSQTKKPIGVVAFNGQGSRYNLTLAQLQELCRRFNQLNFKFVVHDKYGVYPVMQDDTEFPVIYMESQATVRKLAIGNTITQKGQNQIPVLTVTNFDTSSISEFNKNADQKIMETVLNMKLLTPYYYTILMAIKRLKAIGMGTMGVTEDTLYYDPEFIATQKIAELTFVFIHEILHIAMQHSVRFGNRQSHELWNVACDLYINSIICRDFNILPGQPARETIVNGTKCYIKCVDEGVFMETIGMSIDLKKDTPESIYEKLLQENPIQNQLPMQGQGQGQQQQQGKKGKQGQGQGQSQQGQGQQGQGQGQSGQGQQGGQIQQSGQSQAAQSAIGQLKQGIKDAKDSTYGSKKLTEGTRSVNNGIKDVQSGKADSGMQKIRDGIQKMGEAGVDSSITDSMNQAADQLEKELNNQNQSQNQQNQSQNQDNGQGDSQQPGGMKQVSVTYNGKRITGKIMVDVMSGKEATDDTKKTENIDASKKALQRIATKIKMTEEETGESLMKDAGAGAGLTSRYIEFGLSSSVDWRNLLKNLLLDKPRKIFTLADPNTDYMARGMTVAGRRPYGKGSHISNVVFAVDVSGSVSQEDLNWYLSEINNVFTHYKMDGYLIYWSTDVGGFGKFSSIKDMIKIDPKSTGGTDVRCLFEFLNGITKCDGKYFDLRVRDIKAVFILTDGYFDKNYGDFTQAFGKRTVWLIDGNPVTFDPAFGRVIGFERN